MTSLTANTPQLKAVKNMIDAWLTFDLVKVAPFLSKNYKYESFHVPDNQVLSEGHAEVAQAILSGMSKLDVTYHEVIEAPGKVILQATAGFQTVSGATLPYDTLVIISLEEEGGVLKVSSIKDFPDPQKRNAFIAGATKAAAERASAS